METVDDFAVLAYGLAALQQPLDLAELAAAAPGRHLPMADPQTPDWFAAAATAGTSLLEMAPELQVVPPVAAVPVAIEGVDLVRIYAPEQAERPAPGRPKGDREGMKLDLLKELAGLED